MPGPTASSAGDHPAGLVERARSVGTVAADHAAHWPGYSSDAGLLRPLPAPTSSISVGPGTGTLTEMLVGRPGVHVVAPTAPRTSTSAHPTWAATARCRCPGP